MQTYSERGTMRDLLTIDLPFY